MLTRNPFPMAGFGTLRTDFDRAVSRLFQEFDRPAATPFPALNVWEDGQALYAEAEVPGLALGDIEITVIGNELTIKGRRQPVSEKDMAFHRRERGAGEFVRAVTLPTQIDADRVEATLRDGVLALVLPKAEAARARKIMVKSA